MQIRKEIITQNDCYKAGKALKPTGIMIHSTGTKGVMAGKWPARWNKPNIQKAVHAFVDDVEIVQILPWTMRAWHCGGAGNNKFIGIEMCEPSDANWTSREYFDLAYQNMVGITAQLCIEFNISVTPKTVLSHAEGHKLGLSSNHADVGHWWPKMGATMDRFRADVQKEIEIMTVKRISGATRYATAAAYSQTQWPTGCKYVYIVSGETFADGLAAASQSAKPGAVLLTARDRLPAETRAELVRLAKFSPEVIILGGEAAVSKAVANEIAKI